MEMPPLANRLLACVRTHGQRLDFELAQETGITVHDVHEHLAALLGSGEVIACKVTRFGKGKRIDAVMYRTSCYFPPAGPGRKPKPSVATTIAAAPTTPDPLADR